ncbi:MAG: CAP domain-containing protein [Burkholderiaceae bacterium]
MPKHLPASSLPVLRRPRRHSVVALGTLLVAGLAVAPVAHPEAARPACAAALSPDAVLARLNATRARGAVCHHPGDAAMAAPLRWSASLAAVAAQQSREMAELNRMGHRDSQNRGLTERLAAMGYRFSTAAENVAVGYPSLDEVVDAWIDSAPHCENLMNAKVLELGLACSDGSHGAEPGENRYWTLVLGAPPRTR